MSEPKPDSLGLSPASGHAATDRLRQDDGPHPLGPLVELSPDRSGLTRLIAVGVFVGSMTILGVAWWLHANPKGVGTHRQLGLRPCGFLVTTGLPCPTCGMTTAFANAARGHLLQAVWAQPMGAMLAILTAVLACVAVVVMITGRRLEINWYRINPMRVLVAGIVLFLGSWVFKLVVVLLSHRSSGMGA